MMWIAEVLNRFPFLLIEGHLRNGLPFANAREEITEVNSLSMRERPDYLDVKQCRSEFLSMQLLGIQIKF